MVAQLSKYTKLSTCVQWCIKYYACCTSRKLFLNHGSMFPFWGSFRYSTSRRGIKLERKWELGKGYAINVLLQRCGEQRPAGDSWGHVLTTPGGKAPTTLCGPSVYLIGLHGRCPGCPPWRNDCQMVMPLEWAGQWAV